jgi:hypothetical protein
MSDITDEIDVFTTRVSRTKIHPVVNANIKGKNFVLPTLISQQGWKTHQIIAEIRWLRGGVTIASPTLAWSKKTRLSLWRVSPQFLERNEQQASGWRQEWV